MQICFTPLLLSHLCLYHRLHLYLAPSPYDPHPDLQEGFGFSVQCLECKVRERDEYGGREIQWWRGRDGDGGGGRIRLHLYIAPSPYDPHPDLQERRGFRVQCLEFNVRERGEYGDKFRSGGGEMEMEVEVGSSYLEFLTPPNGGV